LAEYCKTKQELNTLDILITFTVMPLSNSKKHNK
jgi:hypothetical protein